jgi:hypothetical protein
MAESDNEPSDSEDHPPDAGGIEEFQLLAPAPAQPAEPRSEQRKPPPQTGGTHDEADNAPLRVCPPHGRLRQGLHPPPAAPLVPHENVAERQFSVGGLLAVMTVVALALTPLQVLPLNTYAGLLGLASLLLLAVQAVARIRMATFQLLWWSLFLLYVAVVVLALRQQWQ